MKPIIIYHAAISPPSRAALLTARVLELPTTVVNIDLLKKEQLSNENLLKINPQHTVPTLDHDGFHLWESRAIACYLAEKYDKTCQLYPKENLEKRAVINQRLYFDATTLFVKSRSICFPILFQGVTSISDNLRNELNTALGFMEVFLSKSKWLVPGDNYTVADICVYTTASSIAEFFDISAYPSINRWLKLCRETIPGASENDVGAKIFGDAVKSKLKN